jgi:hypothetical protein
MKKSVSSFMSGVTDHSTKLRKSLPPMIFDTTGVANINYENDESRALTIVEGYTETFVNKLACDLPTYIPNIIDQMTKEFMRTALPPLLTPCKRYFPTLFLYLVTFSRKTAQLLRRYGLILRRQ